MNQQARSNPPQSSQQQQQTGGDPSAFDLRQGLSLLVRYRWLIASITLGVGIVTLFWTLRQPKIYEGVCTLQYDPSPPRPLGKEVESVSDPYINLVMSQEWYETENQVIESQTVAEIVVKKFGLNRNADFMGWPLQHAKSWKGASVEDAALRLRSHLSVGQLKETRVVLIRVSDHNPTRAQLLANAVAEAYIEKTLEDRAGSTVTALEWLRGQLDTLKEQLDESDLALHNFKESHNVLSLSMEERQNIVANDIQHFNDALTKARTRRIELDSIVKELKAANREDPFEVHATLVLSNPTVEQMKNEFGEVLTERKALATRYGDNHPQLRSLDARMETLKNRMRREIDGLIAATESDLHQIRIAEKGLSEALHQANNSGLELNLQEIQYNRLKRTRENNSKLFELLLQRTAETGLTRMMRVANVHLIDRALKPRHPIKPRLPVNLSIGLFLGFLISLLVTSIVDRMDRTIKHTDDVEALGLSVIGFLPLVNESRRGAQRLYGRFYERLYGSPKPEPTPEPGDATPNKDLVVHSQPKSAMAECCRNIRTNLTFMSPDRPLRALLVTSGAPGEGKTTVAISMSIVIAQSGKRVLLVDTDMRRPRIHNAFGLKMARGVTSVLVGESTLEDAVQETSVPNLFVLPCGPIAPNPSELLFTSRFRDLIDETLRNFDLVIFDSPPLAVVTDAAVMAPQVDGTILIARSMRTTREMLVSSLRQLHDVAAHVVGGIVNEISPSEHKSRYGSYYYSSRYYYGKPEAEGKPSTAG